MYRLDFMRAGRKPFESDPAVTGEPTNERKAADQEPGGASCGILLDYHHHSHSLETQIRTNNFTRVIHEHKGTHTHTKDWRQ